MTTCDDKPSHPAALQTVRNRELPGVTCAALADLFRVLADAGRVRILHALNQAELCVCDLSDLLGVSPSAVSHQLRILRAARLVRYRRQGRRIFYALDDAHVARLVEQAMEHINE